MLQIGMDLRDEANELYALLETLAPADWEKKTLFLGWTPWNVVGHLHFFDHVSLLALTDLDGFQEARKQVIADAQAGVNGKQQTEQAYRKYDAQELLARWHETCLEMAEQLGQSDPKRRLPWFGPDMGVQMFTTARYMETWAHAQAIYDLTHTPRSHTDRIKNIVTIGVKTFGWTFVNRGLEPPGPPPYVCLKAPSGETWEWNEPSEKEVVRGDALDFCQAVTQVRNVADTDLDVIGDVAQQWMSIAQCFAGGPVDPPKPGQRTAA